MAALVFHAAEMALEADEELQTLAFTEGDSARAKSFGMMNEAGPNTVRIAWRDGERGADEAVVEVHEILVAPGRFTMKYFGAHETGPYTAVSVTFDAERTADLVWWLRELASIDREYIRLAVPGAPERLASD